MFHNGIWITDTKAIFLVNKSHGNRINPLIRFGSIKGLAVGQITRYPVPRLNEGASGRENYA